MAKKKKFAYESTVAEMPGYAVEIWNNVPHFIVTEDPDEVGYYYIMYPGSFGAFMDDVDINFCNNAGCVIDGIKIDILPDEDYMPISRCLNIIRTKNIEEAKKAVFELHSLMYMVNIWYMYIPWLRMLDAFYQYNQPINFISVLYNSLDSGFFNKEDTIKMLEADQVNIIQHNFSASYPANA